MAGEGNGGELSAGAVRLRARIARQFSSREAEQLTLFASRLLARVGAAYAEHLGDDDLMAAVVGASGFFTAAGALPRVRAFNPGPSSHGWESPYSIVEVAIQDGPLVLDTVRGFLERRGLVIRHLLHPVLLTVRERDGGLIALRTHGDESVPECFLHLAVDKVLEAEELRHTESALLDLLQAADVATRDRRAMIEGLEATAQDLDWLVSRPGLRGRAGELSEAAAWLRWLADGSFLPIAVHEHRHVGERDAPEPRGDRVVAASGGSRGGSGWEPVADAALGVARRGAGHAVIERGPAGKDDPVLAVRQAGIQNPFPSFGRADEIVVRRLAPDGDPLGERCFVGVLTQKGMVQESADVPLLRRMLTAILAAENVLTGSHEGTEVRNLFNGFPKATLLASSITEVLGDIRSVRTARPDETTVASRLLPPIPVPAPVLRRTPDAAGPPAEAVAHTRLAVLVSVPHHRIDADLTDRVACLVAMRAEGDVTGCHRAGGAGERACIHMTVVGARNAAALTAAACVAEIGAAAQPWTELVAAALTVRHPLAAARRIAARLGDALPAAYVRRLGPRATAAHIERLLALEETGAPQLELAAGGERECVLRIYQPGAPLVLSECVRTLSNLGLRVRRDETVPASLPGGRRVFVHGFVIDEQPGTGLAGELARGRLEAVLHAIACGDVDDDTLNRLVLTADLALHAVHVLRAIAAYAAEAGVVPGRQAVHVALIEHPRAAAALFDHVCARFAPEPWLDPVASRAALRGRCDEITEPTMRRLVWHLGLVVDAMVRTNAFQPARAGAPDVAIKVDVARLPGPASRLPLREIFVHSAHAEGVFVRLGGAAHGAIVRRDAVYGLRETAVSELLTAAVKGATRACAPAAGAFAVKGALSDQAVRQAFATVLRCILDCTDDCRDGRPVRRAGVRAYDDDDVFVAIAPGDGTTTLLDAAHDVAAEHAWWLPGAFASGGAFGYDPQALHVTARGAWECVRANLREAGRIVDDPIVVVGTGDMTDAFFGTAMLDSAAIRLRAALSRRYFFLAPDPDPETSLAERQRLAKTHQGWEGYDVSKLSKGGMILSRTATRVQLTPEARVLLGLEERELTTEQLATAILGAHADVLWAGAGESAPRLGAGAGRTAASSELALGGHELRAAVVAQGDPHGLTPDACVAYARAGGRINSYAIDGGAGLDLGDHEVTLRVLLDDAGRTDGIGADEQERLFRDAAAEVVTRVLGRVRSAHRALSFDLDRCRRWPAGHGDAIAWLRVAEPLAAVLDQLSAGEGLARRRDRSTGLARPELAVVLALSKRALREHLLAAPALLDEPLCQPFLLGRFPRQIRERFPAAVRRHTLRREIVASELANELVDTMGASFVPRLVRDLDADPAAVAGAWVVACALGDGGVLRDAIWRHDDDDRRGATDSSAQRAAHATLTGALDRLTVWVLRVSGSRPAARLMDEIGPLAAELRIRLPACFSGAEAERHQRRVTELEVGGLDGDIARRLAVLEWLDGGLDAAMVAAEVGIPWERAGRIYYRLGTWIDLAWLAARIAALDGDDAWQHRAALGLAEDLREARCRLVRRLSAAGATGAEAEPSRLGGSAAERVARLAADVRAGARDDLAAVQVVVRELRCASEDG